MISIGRDKQRELPLRSKAITYQIGVTCHPAIYRTRSSESSLVTKDEFPNLYFQRKKNEISFRSDAKFNAVMTALPPARTVRLTRSPLSPDQFLQGINTHGKRIMILYIHRLLSQVLPINREWVSRARCQ